MNNVFCQNTDSPRSHEAGHQFLARLGKKRLRPGGRKATEWLFQYGKLTRADHVLEIACNMGTTAAELAERFGCQVIAIDMDQQALAKAGQLINRKQLNHLVSIQQADASKLPFADNSFDVVINEAMLTMYANKAKTRLLREYLRVLKPGGRLLNHDIALQNNQANTGLLTQMRQAINVNAQPLLAEEWSSLLQNAGFCQPAMRCGAMTLLSPEGLIYDEGLLGTVRILRNALKAENRQQFFTMFRYFRQHRQQLNYIAMVSNKPQ